MTELQKRKLDYRFNKILRIGLTLILFIIMMIGCLMIFHEPIISKFITPYKLEKEYEQIQSLSLDDYIKNNEILDGVSNDDSNPNIKFNYNFSNVKPINLLDIKDVNLDKRYIRGQISIPSVNLNLPVLEGISNNNLWLGAGTMKADQKMGKKNYALAGHTMPNDTLLFTPLHSIKKGTSIYITDGKKVFTYKVTHKQIIKPNKVDVLEDSDKNIITLITCSDLKATNRLVIQGDLIGTERITKENKSLFRL